MTTDLPGIVWVDSPAILPATLPPGRFAVVDVAFASGEKFALTQQFLAQHDEALAAWVDHHKHDGWATVAKDPRFVLVPNVRAHACPELVTPSVVANAGPVQHVMAHSDFDGMMSAVNWLRGGVPPYAEANEDARAADSPGRGHVFSERGWRLHEALEEHRDKSHTKDRHSLLMEVAWSLVTGQEPRALGARVDELAAKAKKTGQQAEALVQKGRLELPGLFVIRHPSNLSGRLKKQALLLAEQRAPVGVMVECAPPSMHVTAATFREDIDLSRVTSLPVGRSDFRFVNKIPDAEPVLEELSRVVEAAGG
jgi:hypothetical protein